MNSDTNTDTMQKEHDEVLRGIDYNRLSLGAYIEFLAKGVCRYRNEVKVVVNDHGDGTVYVKIHSNDSDVGAIIGKGGDTLNAFRRLAFTAFDTIYRFVYIEVDDPRQRQARPAYVDPARVVTEGLRPATVEGNYPSRREMESRRDPEVLRRRVLDWRSKR